MLSPEEPICVGEVGINSGDLITNRNANYYRYCYCKQVQILAGVELKPMKILVFLQEADGSGRVFYSFSLREGEGGDEAVGTTLLG